MDCIPSKSLESVAKLRDYWTYTNDDAAAKARVLACFLGRPKQHKLTETWFFALFDSEPPTALPSAGSQSIPASIQASGTTAKPGPERIGA